MPIQTLNPYTNEVEKVFNEMTDYELSVALDKAESAFEFWKNTTVSERSEKMHKVVELLTDRKEYYASLMTKDMGKLFKEGRDWEIPNCIDMCRYYADNSKRFLEPEIIKEVESGEAYIEKHPLGIIFGVMPWNFPFYQVIRFAVPNIMAGNVVLVKHASNVPQCSIALGKLFLDAGFPEGVYTNLLISSSKSDKVVTDKRIQGISLTGSERAGSSVASLAGKNIKKVVLELGGNDPFIVLDDVDIDSTVDLAVTAKMFNSGEVCTAAKRFIIAESIYNEFLEKFTAKMMSLKPGDPMDEKTDYAPLVSDKECDNLLSEISNAVKQGATLVCGGAREEGLSGAWLKPTVITNITSEMDIYNKELFGPVTVVYMAKDEEDAVRIANDSDFGLSSAIITKDIHKAKELASKIESGVTFINSFTISEPYLPFGGIKKSGFGRELGKFGFDEFINNKLIRIV